MKRTVIARPPEGPWARGHRVQLHGLLGRACDLHGDVLTLDARPVAQREDDGAQHRDEQDEPRGLEEIGVVGVEHAPDRLGVADRAEGGRARRRRGCGVDAQNVGTDHPARDDEKQLDQEDHGDQAADREVLEEALAELREIDVQHHDDEQEQDRDCAHIDDDQDHRQELGPEDKEQAGGVHESQDQVQHRVHGIARCDHHEGGRDRDDAEQVEEEGGHRNSGTIQARRPRGWSIGRLSLAGTTAVSSCHPGTLEVNPDPRSNLTQ